MLGTTASLAFKIGLRKTFIADGLLITSQKPLGAVDHNDGRPIQFSAEGE